MVQDSYPLSPLQQGMLFHHLEARTRGVDVEQLEVRLNEPIDTNRLADAWARVAKQNPILRTRFRWEGLQSSGPGGLARDRGPVRDARPV